MNAQPTLARPSGFGALAFGLLLAVYFGALTLVSGWSFTVTQFSEFWYYIVPLAAGFGLQVALYAKNPREISVGYFETFSARWALRGHAFAGLNDGGPDFGLGVGLVRWVE